MTMPLVPFPLHRIGAIPIFFLAALRSEKPRNTPSERAMSFRKGFCASVWRPLPLFGKIDAQAKSWCWRCAM
jgi:hypothetical protein